MHVDAWVSGQHIHCTVRDAGRGISSSFLPHVFDRFRQADSSYTRAGGGLGLGLAIVRSVGELHGGQAEALSAGHGRGATFSIVLPTTAVPNPVQSSEVRPSESAPERLDGVRVLVVDDRADERELFQAILSSHGAIVDVAASAREALERLLQAPPAVLVSDIAMPEQDGYTLLAAGAASRGRQD